MNKVQSTEYMLELSTFAPLFSLISILFGIVVVVILGQMIYERVQTIHSSSKKQREITKNSLKSADFSKIKDDKKGEILRKIAEPDALDPGPNGYTILDDGGKEIYVRCFTIAETPKNTDFAKTFAGLFDFPGCISSVFINPLAEGSVIAKMDRQITVLASEYSSAQGDPNRTRKISSQYQEVYNMADQVESGDTKMFDVGFGFVLWAESLPLLNKISDTFRSKALSKSIIISSCFAVQAEAFEACAPFNHVIKVGNSFIKQDGIKYHQWDKYAVSTLFNYTQNSFSHKEGIILGHDIQLGTPIFYDLFDPSHDGFTMVIAGKTGSGKSATIKMFVSRSVFFGYRFVCIDSEVRKGTNEGEFAAVCELVNGVNYKIANNSDCIMNPFEISESPKSIKTAYNTTMEILSLDLNDKISVLENTLLTMLQGNKEFSNLENTITIRRILVDTVFALYQSFGIYDGKPESLYTEGYVTVNGTLQSGRVKKKLPTMSDFYKRVLIASKNNKDESLNSAYNIILMGLKDFVKELHYTAKTYTFLTGEQVSQLKYRDVKSKQYTYTNENGEDEDVISIHGIRSYYDGQSTFSVDAECPFTNIDISLLPENEKILARQIAMDFLIESFIKKNSEVLENSKKLVAIFDECHKNFKYEYARKAIDDAVRTVRKRYAGIILSSQTLSEYKNYPETQAILKQATSKFIFKQDVQDREYLKSALDLTDAQVEYITTRLGGDKKKEADQDRHRGEVCIVDNMDVAFCKVDYLKPTEKYAVETNAKKVEEMMSNQKAG